MRNSWIKPRAMFLKNDKFLIEIQEVVGDLPSIPSPIPSTAEGFAGYVCNSRYQVRVARW